MRVACISDTHGMWEKVQFPEADVLVFAGDILRNYTRDRYKDAELQLDDLAELDLFLASLRGNYKEIICIAGNHDWAFYQPHTKRLAIELLKNATYLEDTSHEIEGVLFYGSPWQPFFNHWAFNFPVGDKGRLAQLTWSAIPNTVDVLVTHGPPHSILDRTREGRTVGCPHLWERVKQVQPLAHIFGHIHECYGSRTIGRTQFVNASLVTRDLVATNSVQVIEL